MHARRRTLPALLLLVVAIAAGCGGGGGGSPSASAAPSTTGVDSAEDAWAAVAATDERFASLEPYDDELIGQCCFYRVTEVEGGYQVDVEVGWGDCPAGCINKHRWTYAVNPDGVVALLNEEGEPLPPGPFPPQDGAGAGGY
jgi:hypothetical protein